MRRTHHRGDQPVVRRGSLKAACRLKRQDLFTHRVEVDAALLHVRDVAQVRSLRGAVADQHVTVRQLARASRTRGNC